MITIHPQYTFLPTPKKKIQERSLNCLIKTFTGIESSPISPTPQGLEHA